MVFEEKLGATELIGQLQSSQTPLRRCQLVRPFTSKQANAEPEPQPPSNEFNIKVFDFDSLSLLNPKLARKSRQKTMAVWLMPFGFLTGLVFSEMTGLQTFTELGLGQLGEPLMGGLLGMGSGLLGSYVAAASVNSDKTGDIQSLRKKSLEGRWLLIIETPLETELPWQIFQRTKPIEVVQINDL